VWQLKFIDPLTDAAACLLARGTLALPLGKLALPGLPPSLVYASTAATESSACAAAFARMFASIGLADSFGWCIECEPLSPLTGCGQRREIAAAAERRGIHTGARG
jgi:hypothetical protein